MENTLRALDTTDGITHRESDREASSIAATVRLINPAGGPSTLWVPRVRVLLLEAKSEFTRSSEEDINPMNHSAEDPRVGLAQNRTGMARFRTQLALDRTTLAWIRTTLTMATFGFGTVGFFRALREKSPTPESIQIHQGAIRFGVALIVIGLVATILAGVSHWLTLRTLRRNQTPALSQWPLSIAVAMFLALIGFLSLWYVFQR